MVANFVATTRIAQRILVIRGHKVMTDADLAALYDVPTKRLNELVANCDHLSRLKFASAMPCAFTEHGALMAASVLNTTRAVERSHRETHDASRTRREEESRVHSD